MNIIQCISLAKDIIIKLIDDIMNPTNLFPHPDYENYENIVIIIRIFIAFLVVTLLYDTQTFVKGVVILVVVVLFVAFYKASSSDDIKTIPQTKKESINKKSLPLEDNKSMKTSSYLGNISLSSSKSENTMGGVSIMDNITLGMDDNSDYDKLFFDTNRGFEEQVKTRNSVESITYDMGNTVEFAKALSSPILTCKEDNLKCLEYEDLRYKRQLP